MCTLLFLLLAPLARAAEPLASVDGVPITSSDVEAVLTTIDPAMRAQVDEAMVVEQLVVSQLLAAEAARRDLAASPEGKAAVARATREALSSVLLSQILAERLSSEVVARHYTENPTRYTREEVHARHILVSSEGEATGLLTALRGGASFVLLAADRSRDPGSSHNGGDLGWFSREMMVEPFAAAAFAAKPGEVVGPIQTQFGWHLIEVLGRRDKVPLEEVEEEIRAELQNQVLAAYVDELKSRAVIVNRTATSVVTPIADGPAVPAARGKEPPFTLVAFIDMQCPHCHEMHLALDRLVAARADVRVVYRHYPLEQTCNPAVTRTGRGLACEAARAVLCAEGNAALTDDLLDNGDVLDRAGLAAAGPRHGVAEKKWAACLVGADVATRLAADVAEGARLGVEGTPTIFVRAAGRWFRFDGDPSQLPAALEQAAKGG